MSTRDIREHARSMERTFRRTRDKTISVADNVARCITLNAHRDQLDEVAFQGGKIESPSMQKRILVVLLVLESFSRLYWWQKQVWRRVEWYTRI